MIRINLIPQEERIVASTGGPNWKLVSLLVAPVIYALALFTISMYQNHQTTVLAEMIRQEEANLKKYKPAVTKLKQLRDERTQIETRLSALEEIDRNRELPVRMLETVGRSVPRYLWIEKIEETGAPGIEIAIQGNTFSNLIVSDFMDRLTDSEMFGVPELTITKEKKIGETRVVEFKLVTRGEPTVTIGDMEVKTALAYDPLLDRGVVVR